MNKIKRMPVYLILIALTFYLLPLFKNQLGGDMVVLWIITPLVCFLLGYIFGLFNNISFLFIIAIAVLFIPAVIFYYRQIAMLYALTYGLVAMIGNVLGAKHFKARHERQEDDQEEKDKEPNEGNDKETEQGKEEA